MAQPVTQSLNALNATVAYQTDAPGAYGTLGIQVGGGGYTGTLVFEATVDGSNWFSVLAFPVSGGAAVASITGVLGQFIAPIFGYQSVRIRFSAYTIGSVLITLDAAAGTSVPFSFTVSPGTDQTSSGSGSLVSEQFISSAGGPPLSTGIPSGFTLDAEHSIEGKGSQQMILSTPSIAGQSALVFQDNPWIAGLLPGQKIILSGSPNGGATEEVVVGKNNTPAVGPGPVSVSLLTPVVNSGSSYATFDTFSVNVGPRTGMTEIGVPVTAIVGYDDSNPDQKRPMKLVKVQPGGSGAMLVGLAVDPNRHTEAELMRDLMEKMLTELRTLNANFAVVFGDGKLLQETDSLSAQLQ